MSVPLPLVAAVSPSVTVLDHTDSTNADMVARAVDAPHLSVIVTTDQRAGRGRLDRTWIAPAGSAVAVSVLLHVTDVPLRLRGWIPLAAGVAMTEAIAAQLPRADVRAKWPNDVLVDGRKICGILAEATAGDRVVVGAGVNTAMTADALPVPTATSFATLGVACDDDLLLRDYLRRLDALVAALPTDPAVVREAALAVSGTVGSHVRVSMPDGSDVRGIARSIDIEGLLVVDTADAVIAVSAGDVVHVRPE